MPDTASTSWQFKLFYDGECPLCVREARYMERLDRGRGLLVLEDLTAPTFDAAEFGMNMNDMIDRIHGITRDGTVVEGLEAFRHAYAAVGRGWYVTWTGWPVLKPICDIGYRLFARYRYAITLRKRPVCDDNRCYIKHSRKAVSR